MNKKIVCLIDSLGSGGAERQIVGLAVLLRQKGYSVELLSYHSEEFYSTIAREGGINPVILRTKNNAISKLLAVRDYIRRTGGCDWLITYKGGPNAIGCILRMLGGNFRLIVSERTSNRSRKLSTSDKMRYQLYRLATVVSPNSYTESEFIKENYPWLKNKTKTITNFTQTNFFVPSETLNHQNINILTVARVSKTKNIINVIEAINKLKQEGLNNVHFDWYGRVPKGQEEYASLCLKTIDNYGLNNFVSFHPASSDILPIYQNCDIFMLPSLYEGFPNVICEAMSCGKPIICSNVCDNPQIVGDGENGLLFDPNNVDDIAKALYKVINMSWDKLQQWGKISRKKATETFSEESFVNKYIDIIEQS